MRVDSVFQNIKMLKVPAGRLLAIMNIGYSRSLGVSCDHCHNTSDFSSEEKIQKDVTGQMADMAAKINNELLKNIQGVKPELLIVNCTTCHRGEIKPALNMPVPLKN
jgi:DNA-directed RNA polymerase subunit M/transcription elongation factor TFIIS